MLFCSYAYRLSSLLSETLLVIIVKQNPDLTELLVIVSDYYFCYFCVLTLAVHAKSIVAILHLLVALSQHFRAPIRLPDHVSIQVVVVQVSECSFYPAAHKKISHVLLNSA